jgi:hypothetical protein
MDPIGWLTGGVAALQQALFEGVVQPVLVAFGWMR